MTFTGQTGADINVLAPNSGLITGPGGTITNTTLDGGNSSYHGYTTSALPAGGTAILSTATASQVVCFDYIYGSGHVIVDTIPVEFYGGTGNFGIFHKNLFNFAAPAASNTKDDYYTIRVQAGQQISLVTTTPGDGANQHLNSLDPKLELYNPSGALVASDDNGAPDSRNAKLSYVALANGYYPVHVTSANRSTGEYVLSASLRPGHTGRSR